MAIVNLLLGIWTVYFLFSLILKPIGRLIRALELKMQERPKQRVGPNLKEDGCYIINSSKSIDQRELDTVRVLRLSKNGRYALLQSMRTGVARTYDKNRDFVVMDEFDGKMWMENNMIRWDVQRTVKQDGSKVLQMVKK